MKPERATLIRERWRDLLVTIAPADAFDDRWLNDGLQSYGINVGRNGVRYWRRAERTPEPDKVFFTGELLRPQRRGISGILALYAVGYVEVALALLAVLAQKDALGQAYAGRMLYALPLASVPVAAFEAFLSTELGVLRSKFNANELQDSMVVAYVQAVAWAVLPQSGDVWQDAWMRWSRRRTVYGLPPEVQVATAIFGTAEGWPQLAEARAWSFAVEAWGPRLEPPDLPQLQYCFALAQLIEVRKNPSLATLYPPHPADGALAPHIDLRKERQTS